MDHDGDFSAYASARWGSLVRAAVFLGCGVEDAQDLAQTTLVKCYTSWRKVSSARDRDAYVYRMLVNCHRDSRRRRWWGERATNEELELDTPVADDTESVDVADSVRRALAGLSEDHRRVIVLRYFVHLTERQTAEALGIAPGTVKSRLARALSQLALDDQLTDLTQGATP